MPASNKIAHKSFSTRRTLRQSSSDRNPGLSPREAAAHRANIQTEIIIERMQGFALAEVDPETGIDPALNMTATQLQAAVKLLGKTLPDLSATQVSGDPDAPPAALTIKFVSPDTIEDKSG